MQPTSRVPEPFLATLCLAATLGLTTLTCAAGCSGKTESPDSVGQSTVDGENVDMPVSSPPEDSSRGDSSQPAAIPVASSPEELKKAMVLVSVRFNDQDYGVPGIVLHRDGDRTLVISKSLSELERAKSNGTRLSRGPEYFILCGEGSGRREVRAEWIASSERNAFYILSAPADQLPAPIKTDALPGLTVPMPVQIIGYEIDRAVKPPAFAPFTEQGVLSQIQPASRRRSQFFVIRSSETPSISLALVAANSGHVIGYSTGAPGGDMVGSGGEYSVWPTSSLTEFLEPRVVFLNFGFASGDAKQVVNEFVAVIDDPLEEISSPRLVIQPVDETGPQLEYMPGDPNAPRHVPEDEQRRTNMLPDGKTLDLVREPASQAVKLQRPWLEQRGDRNVWVARFTSDNPGLQRKYVFRAQLSYTDSGGQAVYSTLRRLEFEVDYGEKDRVPKIPGLDGRPLDYPRPTRLADGCYRVTSDCTRVQPPAASEQRNLPRPARRRKSVAGELSFAGKGNAVALEVSPPERLYTGHAPTVPAVFSPDGAWLYLVDTTNTIRKISTSDLTEEVHLQVGVACTSLAYSRTGLVAAVKGAGAVWVLDPQSLEVKRVIPAAGARTVVASPKTDLAFVEGRIEKDDCVQLLMLDLEQGRALHRMKSTYRTRRGRFGLAMLGRSFEYGFGKPFLTQDGKYLYLVARADSTALCRFRIEGNDLIYEQALPFLPAVVTDRRILVQKPDDRSYYVYDVNAPAEPKCEFDLTKRRGALAVDRQFDAIYGIAEGLMFVFDSTGQQLGQIKVPGYDVYHLLPHPEGKRMLGWSERGIWYYDLEPGRLSKALGREPES